MDHSRTNKTVSFSRVESVTSHGASSHNTSKCKRKNPMQARTIPHCGTFRRGVRNEIRKRRTGHTPPRDPSGLVSHPSCIAFTSCNSPGLSWNRAYKPFHGMSLVRPAPCMRQSTNRTKVIALDDKRCRKAQLEVDRSSLRDYSAFSFHHDPPARSSSHRGSLLRCVVLVAYLLLLLILGLFGFEGVVTFFKASRNT